MIRFHRVWISLVLCNALSFEPFGGPKDASLCSREGTVFLQHEHSKHVANIASKRGASRLTFCSPE